ncbi:uncharacterized protein B0H18DRAFT_1116092 [Fomitopsis serialis]|uniref:uncharacterized protein n=1 Tax=Fomitopsis serialis TaxID=139415 RepID=UPI0020072CDD|nr:uncharacterized protein B0H18DRAFT_1116092 [Neoantrodia serialis]KAH9931840.1 hypothetical protein B0H18DRAFT_1116092 [Neoantrodia serialis]
MPPTSPSPPSTSLGVPRTGLSRLDAPSTNAASESPHLASPTDHSPLPPPCTSAGASRTNTPKYARDTHKPAQVHQPHSPLVSHPRRSPTTIRRMYTLRLAVREMALPFSRPRSPSTGPPSPLTPVSSSPLVHTVVLHLSAAVQAALCYCIPARLRANPRRCSRTRQPTSTHCT